ncbi:hypothetical protein [Streptomyces sp. JV180]|uniref:hypothetical protein n=1 Tax=Streptomyces sp. JV180 TaxID=858634 RepID=UPI00168BABC7|nr:hypothetical protein [Streptomyces sp. JV180]MBD3544488.1 hypothetical protein [Streptomyces sp. JV180]
MIPATEPFVARYKHIVDGQTRYTFKPVIAWGDNGDALVVDTKAGRLEPATHWNDFVDLGEGTSPIVAAIPGGDWKVTYRGEESGTTDSSPLLAWGIRADGTTTPIDVDGSGFSDDPTGDDRFLSLDPPRSATDPQATTDAGPYKDPTDQDDYDQDIA